ncbi:glycosyltransferase [Hymenobacter sp. BT683]|uniref:Glycosyltransferase n=1 Tax=Hymenobacter jeongseonensis TaxID=2791027 RepID=A0ABS0IJP6_9BACT|nr:glycosyltransferase [Hymenobacter jeongseonensis]MBF9238571.1 glycosyltransferase [Hymenobacter jeongseonensis]
MQAPRVLMLPKWYPNRYDDQDGDFVGRHVAAIAAFGGVEVAVLFAAVARGPLPSLIDAEEDFSGAWPTLRYYYRAAPTGLPLLDKPLKLLLYFWCLLRGYRRICRHWGKRPALVHVHVLLRTGVFAWALRAMQNIPFLITEHWTAYLPGRAENLTWVRRRLTRAVVRRAAALHTVSDNLRTALAALGAVNNRTVVIPNVVDTALFHPPAHPAWAASRPVLLHVAAFNEAAKNLGGLLRVVAGLRTQIPGLRLRIGGYGPDEAHVRAQAAQLGLLADGTVVFLGKLTHAEVAEEMRQAACFVLFSNFENLPCVLVEAQASGLPAVATKVGGVPELLPADGRFGELVAAGDEAALATALQTVLATTYSATALRANAEARFSVPAVGAAFRALYQQVLGRQG